MLFQLLQRYQGLTKQMKNETTVKPTMVLPTPKQPPPPTTSSKSDAKTTKVSRTLPVTPVTTKGSKPPKRIETPPSVSPEESTRAYMMETPPDSKANHTKDETPKLLWWPGYVATSNGNRTKPDEPVFQAELGYKGQWHTLNCHNVIY